MSMTASYHSGSGLRPAIDSGSRMFSPAVSVGTRLKDWKTNPIRSRRRRVSCLSVEAADLGVADEHLSRRGVSSAAQQCISVDLPEPDGPITAVNSPAAMSRVTPSRARTSAIPVP